ARAFVVGDLLRSSVRAMRDSPGAKRQKGLGKKPRTVWSLVTPDTSETPSKAHWLQNLPFHVGRVAITEAEVSQSVWRIKLRCETRWQLMVMRRRIRKCIFCTTLPSKEEARAMSNEATKRESKIPLVRVTNGAVVPGSPYADIVHSSAGRNWSNLV